MSKHSENPKKQQQVR